MNTPNEIGSIAIIGMSGRFPGAKNIDEFWQGLVNGVEAISFFPDEEQRNSGVYQPVQHHANYVRAGYVLEDIDLFDASFFDFSPREAELMDPQHRLLMECAWEALESAGYNPETSDGQIGIYAGASISNYLLFNLLPNLNVRQPTNHLQSLIGNDKDYLATHISYKFNLKGPSVSVQTACSTSLVSVSLACQSLLNYQCDIALAGGVTVRVPQKVGYLYEDGSIFSPDGHCRAFDAKAQGTVFGSGVGVVVLKRMQEAIADRDCIHAVIKGTAINNDGALKVGYTAPSVDGQAEVIAMAHAMAGIEAETVTYVEAHGTGTPLGDPIEVAALTQVFRASTQKKGFCAVGSVKTNVGHLEAAAGVASLIKTILALKHKLLPPSLHFEQPNPEIDFASSPFYVNTTLSEWKTDGTPRRAGVSSFGIGGTNAHVVLEEAPETTPATSAFDRPCHVLTLSAKSEKALQELAQRYEYFLASDPEASLADVCFTANTGRSHFDHRLAVVAESTVQLQGALGAFAAGRETFGLVSGQIYSRKPSKIAFLFTGQGSQYLGMGRQLYDNQPIFRKTLDLANEILHPYLEKPLLEVLYPEPGATSPLDETAYTQLALFALEYALAQLWKSWGITPDAVMGHSVGEYVAACVAGVFSLEDGLKLIASKADMMQNLPQDGEMVAVFAEEARVAVAIQPYSHEVAIAAINGSKNIVISGGHQALRAVCAALEAEGVKTEKLQVSYAFHSPLMKPMLAAFERIVAEVSFSPPQIGLISNITGGFANAEIATPEYWCRRICQPVRFAAGMETLYQQGYEVFVEVGSKPTLLGMGRNCFLSELGLWLPSLRQGQSDWQQLLSSLGALYVHGVQVNWSGFDQEYPRRRLELPTYPFQRQRYWIETANVSDLKKPQMSTKGAGSKILHPLLGQRLHSAALKNQEIQFESQISKNSPAFLAHHRIYQTAILPATAYLEMALAAGAAVFQCDNLVVQEVLIQQALILPEDEAKKLQLILIPEGTSAYSFQIFSLLIDAENEEPSWTLHASGKVLVGDKEPEPPQSDLVSLQAQCIEEISIENYYQQFRERGIDYGHSFQAIEQLWRRVGAALGRIRLPEALVLEACDYHLHPVLLDACFQVLQASCPDRDKEDVYVPVGLESLRVYRRPSTLLWSQAQIRPVKDSTLQQTLTADLHVFDPTGAMVAQVKGLSIRRASRQTLLRGLQKDLRDWLYQITWQPKAREYNPELVHKEGRPGSWLIFADQRGIGIELASILKKRGERCVLVSAGQAYKVEEAEHYYINPAEPLDFQRLLKDSLGDNQLPYRGVVHLWSLEETPEQETTLTTLQKAQVLGCGSALHLVQALAKAGLSEFPRLWLVTRGTQAVGPTPAPVQVQQATLWGLGRVITLEHPNLHCVLLDLEPLGEANEIQALFEELWFTDKEDQVAYRQGIRYVARLVRRTSPDREIEGQNRPFQLKISSDGILENLTRLPMTRRQPQPGEVEIQVRATGLNFRDVLNALGMLKEHAYQMGIDSTTDVPFGFECAGKIVAVGENVENYQVGNEVIAVLTTGGFSSFGTVKAEFVVPKPEDLSFSEAATIPVAFLTAYYGLHTSAKIQPGNRVLIHAAAGGVGQAAVQLAQRAGAEVLVTASPSKWEFLKSVGVKHVMNSRTLDFAEEVMAITAGQGVDIVLNSLSGKFIPKTLEVLGKGGRFVEIGKIGIWDERQVREKRPDISYFPFDLGEVTQQNPGLITAILKELMHSLRQGSLKPLPLKEFPIEDAVSAFQYMAQAKHIGKVVLSQPEMAMDGDSLSRQPVRGNSSYLITGGLGALGLKVVHWLVEQGARHLVLTGRRGTSNAAQQTVSQLEQAGAQVLVVKADVSNPEDVARVLEIVKSSMPPLRGIVHAAGVLDDGILLQQSWDRFTRVMAPKVEGAWNLHTLTQNMPLDFFVCFSSITSLLGSPGQGNYAAANAFMDALAHHRRVQGIPGLSINWGPWADAGMAAELGSHNKRRLTDQGWDAIAPQQGLQVLEQLLSQPFVQIGVMPINWSTFIQKFPPGGEPPLLSELASQVRQQVKDEQPAKQLELFRGLKEASASDRLELLVAYLQSQVTKVLGLARSHQPKPHQSLYELGLDSLMGIELKNRIGTELGVNVPIQKFAEGSSITQLALALLEQLALASIIQSEPLSTELSDDIEEITI